MENLGEVAQLTGGVVNIVDPLNLDGNFNSILEKPIVATQVRLTLLMPSFLYLCGPLKNEFDQSEPVIDPDHPLQVQKITKFIGNAFDDSEVAIQFGVQDDIPPELDCVPFQTQIQYTGLNGNKSIRVITHLQPLTMDQNEVAKQVDIAVFSAVVGQVNAALAQQGEYSSAFNNAVQNRTFLESVAHSDEQKQLLQIYDQQLESIESVLNKQMTHDQSNQNFSTRENRLDNTAVELYQLRGAKKAACSIM